MSIKVHILLDLLAEVPHRLTLRVEEEVVKLAEVECESTFLALLIVRGSCRCCLHHYFLVFGQSDFQSLLVQTRHSFNCFNRDNSLEGRGAFKKS